eukprot:jgi/Undpi1/5868/HiC_scaffold_2.g01142.m1
MAALFVQPILRWAGTTPRSSTHCVAEASLSPPRRPTMAAEPPSGGDSGRLDDPSAVSGIPDAIGTAALQERLDFIKRRDGRRSANSGIGKDGAPGPSLPVWVLMFDSGPQSGAQRGLYCLWSNGVNSVVAFEGRDGALRYALELKAQGLGLPGPTRVTVNDLQKFCSDRSFGLEVVPANVVPVAPDKNKKDQGFDRNKLHQGRGGRGNMLSPAVSEEASVFTPEDMREWRAKFERLYSQE